MTSSTPRSTNKSLSPKSSSSRMAGYTLVELIVTMVIIAILATQVIFTYTDPMARLKSAAFNLRADMNLARSEAVNRHGNILVEFVPGDIDGYRIWDNATLIKEVSFRDIVQFYDADAADGPTVTPDNGTWVVGDGIAFAGNSVTMQSDGTSDSTDDNDTVYLYVPNPGDHTVMRAPPMALVVTPHTGRVRLERWRVEDQAWKEK